MIYITTAFHYEDVEKLREEKREVMKRIIESDRNDEIFSPCFLSPMIGINKVTTIGAWMMMMLENAVEVIVLGSERTPILEEEIALAQKFGIAITLLN